MFEKIKNIRDKILDANDEVWSKAEQRAGIDLDECVEMIKTGKETDDGDDDE